MAVCVERNTLINTLGWEEMGWAEDAIEWTSQRACSVVAHIPKPAFCDEWAQKLQCFGLDKCMCELESSALLPGLSLPSE